MRLAGACRGARAERLEEDVGDEARAALRLERHAEGRPRGGAAAERVFERARELGDEFV